MSSRVLHTTEHDLKEGLNENNYDAWVNRLREAEAGRSITFAYSAEEPEIGKELEQVANQVKTQEKILVYGECHEKGGGGEGVIPTVFQTYLCFSVITVSAFVAKVFLEELAKDIYKSTIHKFFDARKKASLNKTIVLKVSNGVEDCTFIFESSLTTIECSEALKQVNKVREKAISAKKQEDDYEPRIFIYSPKEKSWIDF